jgi:hypothetical protein
LEWLESLASTSDRFDVTSKDEYRRSYLATLSSELSGITAFRDAERLFEDQLADRHSDPQPYRRRAMIDDLQLDLATEARMDRLREAGYPGQMTPLFKNNVVFTPDWDPVVGPAADPDQRGDRPPARDDHADGVGIN